MQRPTPPRRRTALARLARRRARLRLPLPAGRASTLQVGNYRIHSVEAGSGEECVVLLHGLSGSSRWWFRNVPAFAAGYRTLVPDVIGFGRSRNPGPIPSIPDLAAALADWMEATGASPAHVVGHSMGGQLAVHLAARFPERVRRLVLVDAAGIPRPRGPTELVRFVREVAPPGRWGDLRFIPTMAGDALVAGPRTILRALFGILRDDVRPLLGRVAVPTLLLWGERDGIVPVADGRVMRAEIPGARLLLLSGAAHNPMVDRPDDFNGAVLRFLAGEEVGE